MITEDHQSAVATAAAAAAAAADAAAAAATAAAATVDAAAGPHLQKHPAPKHDGGVKKDGAVNTSVMVMSESFITTQAIETAVLEFQNGNHSLPDLALVDAFER